MVNQLRNFTVLFSSLYLLALTVPVVAQEQPVSISIDKRTVVLGDSAVFTVMVESADMAAPEIPSNDDFEISYMGVQRESFASFNLVINGRQVRNNTSGSKLKHNYRVTPKRVGVLSFPSFVIVTEPGKGIRTRAFEVEVLPQPDLSKDIFVTQSADKDTVYLGEKVTVTFRWYIAKSVEDFDFRVPWMSDLKNFNVKNPDLDPNQSYMNFLINGTERVPARKTAEVINGRKYTVISFQKVLEPIGIGKYTLDPVEINCSIVQSYQRNRRQDFFEDFFGDPMSSRFFGLGSQAVTEPYGLSSEPLELIVKDVPDKGQPASFTGAVGHYVFSTELSSDRVKVGEPITVTMRIVGDGNTENVQMPELGKVEGFRDYEPESLIAEIEQNGRIYVGKTFEKIIIPSVQGKFTIPKIEFTYFNTDTQQYQTVSKGPFKVQVDPSDIPKEMVQPMVSLSEPEGAIQQQIKLIQQDIHFIKTSLGQVYKKEKPLWANPWASIPLTVLPPLFCFLAVRHLNQKQRLSVDVVYRRRTRAFKTAQKRLHQLKRQSELDLKEHCFMSIGILNQYLSEKLNLPQGLDSDGYLAEMRVRELSEDLIHQLESLYLESDSFKYGFTHQHADKAQIEDRIESLIQTLDKVIK